MDDVIAKFIRTKHINSFQKLRFLLFLQEHPGLNGDSREFAERLYLSHTVLLEKIIHDLQQDGLVVCIEGRYRLSDEPEVQSCLQHLARIFKDPLARQELLAQIREFESRNCYDDKGQNKR